jgi:hypothetical protein
VEGKSEVLSLPILLRRVAAHMQIRDLSVLRPLPVRRYEVVKPGELERHVELVAKKLGGGGGILVLLDADDDCPRNLGPALLRRAQAVEPRLPLSVVLASREFEAFFLAGMRSLAGSPRARAGRETRRASEMRRSA